MNGAPNDHARAREALLAARVEPLAPADHVRLAAHVAACEPCARFARALGDGLAALASVPLAAPPDLARLTQRRLRARAQELCEVQARLERLAWSCCVALASGAGWTLEFWRAYQWFGAHAPSATLVRVALVPVVWLLPLAVGALAAVLVRAGARRDSHTEVAS